MGLNPSDFCVAGTVLYQLSCIKPIGTLRKIKNFTPFSLREHLAESLVLSRLNYRDTVLPSQHLLKRLQRIQYIAASFVTGRCGLAGVATHA